MEDGEMLSTKQMLDQLTEEGFRVTESYLSFLVRERHVAAPAKVLHSLVWQPEDVNRVKGELRRRGRAPSATSIAGSGHGR
jgi:hypothetical protein